MLFRYVIILIQSKGCNMLQAVIISLFQSAKTVKKAIKQKLHPGFHGQNVGGGNVKLSTWPEYSFAFAEKAFMIQYMFTYLDGNSYIKQIVGIWEHICNIHFFTFYFIKFEYLRPEITGIHIIAQIE